MLFPFRLCKTSGHSMEPAIRSGSFVLICLWARRFKTGDIVAFKYDQKILIKRIIEMHNNQVKIRGDNSSDSLSVDPIEKSQVIGKIIWGIIILR
jgi:phage repressor protein C with HTH and peptisase S24 domain